jgi:hypothetical protein
MFPGDRRVLVRQPLDPQDIAQEKSEHSGMPEGKRQSVSVAELTRMKKRSIGGLRHLISTSNSTNVRLTEAEVRAVSMVCRTTVGSHR